MTHTRCRLEDNHTQIQQEINDWYFYFGVPSICYILIAVIRIQHDFSGYDGSENTYIDGYFIYMLMAGLLFWITTVSIFYGTFKVQTIPNPFVLLVLLQTLFCTFANITADRYVDDRFENWKNKRSSDPTTLYPSANLLILFHLIPILFLSINFRKIELFYKGSKSVISTY